jgi:hypothetical protein
VGGTGSPEDYFCLGLSLEVDFLVLLISSHSQIIITCPDERTNKLSRLIKTCKSSDRGAKSR